MRIFACSASVLLLLGLLGISLLRARDARVAAPREASIDVATIRESSQPTDGGSAPAIRPQSIEAAPDGTASKHLAATDPSGARRRSPDAGARAEMPTRLPPSGPALRRELEAIESELGPALQIHPAVLDAFELDGAARILFSLPDGELDEGLQQRIAQPLASDAAPGHVQVFERLDWAAARLEADAFAALLRSGETNLVELDVVHRPSLTASLPVIDADLAQAAGADGDGQAVAVIDTGVDLDHPMFAGRIVEEACFSLLSQCPNAARSMLGPGAAEACPISGCGHGTAVAGIALARSADASLVGVAPNANLIAIQAFSEIAGELGAYTSDILASLQHVLSLAAFPRHRRGEPLAGRRYL